MRCPVDNETLVMADRNGVEIDYCPKCRGVWLDRGELDKIIERVAGDAPAAARSAAAPAASPQPQPGAYQQPPVYQQPPGGMQQPQGRRDYDDDDDDYRRTGYRKKRRESFLGDLFDF
jgi:hypothetical protein